MPPGPIDLLLPSSLDRAAARGLLEDRLELSVARPRVSDRVLLDSFDGRLRAAGLRAERPAGRDAPIVLHEPGAPVRRAQVPRAKRHLVEELPAGALRERLVPVLGERALLPAVRVRSTLQSLAVVDGEAKSVVRMELEHPELIAAKGARVPLSTRLSLRPVLGYDRDYERTLSLLRDELGLEPAKRPLYDEAVRASGGRPGGVATRVRADLAPGTRTDVAAALVLRRLVKVTEANLPGATDDLDPEFLHDVRVSIRRSRSVIRELRAIYDPEARARVHVELKWAQELTGPVRDLDVQLEEWPELIAHLSPERAAELEPLRKLLARRRVRERTALRRGLRGARFAAMLAMWRELGDRPPAPELDEQLPQAALPIEATAGERIVKVHRRILRDGGRIAEDSPPEALHDLRKRGKELRYLLELFGSVFPSEAVDPIVSSLKDLQRVLGRFQDRAVQVELLRELRDDLAGEPGGPAALIALGPALDALLADEEDAREEFSERFSRFADASTGKSVRKVFGSIGS